MKFKSNLNEDTEEKADKREGFQIVSEILDTQPEDLGKGKVINIRRVTDEKDEDILEEVTLEKIFTNKRSLRDI